MLSQIGGALTGGAALGKAFGLFSRGGRTSGLSGIVRRARGGQVVRMQLGGSPADAYTSPFMKDLASGKYNSGYQPQSYKDYMAQKKAIADQLIEAGVTGASPTLEYLMGTPESYEAALGEQEAYRKFVDERPTEFPELFQDQYGETTSPEEMMAAASFGVEEKPAAEEKPVAATTKTPDSKKWSVVDGQPTAPEETKSKFLSGLDDLSTGDLLKLAGTAFAAGESDSFGKFMAQLGVGAGDIFSAAEKRKLSAAQNKELMDLKRRAVAADELTAKASAAGKNKLEFKTPTTNDVAFTKASLADKGLNVSDAAVREIAMIQKAYDHLTHDQVVAALIQDGRLKVDEPGFFRSMLGADPEIQAAAE